MLNSAAIYQELAKAYRTSDVEAAGRLFDQLVNIPIYDRADARTKLLFLSDLIGAQDPERLLIEQLIDWFKP